MKKISLLFAFVLLLASCSENNFVTPDPDSDEGVHTSLGLSVAPMKGDKGDAVRSRSVTGVNETLINRLWVLQFKNAADGKGVLLKKSYMTVADAAKIDIVLRENIGEETSNIYLVANAGKSILSNFYGNEADFKAAVGAFTSELGLVTSNGDQTVRCIPMCGNLLNKKVSNLGVDGGINVELTRMLARIDFTCNLTPLAAAKFALKNIRLCGVPNAVKYFDEKKDPADLHPAAPAANSMIDYSAEPAVSGTKYTFYVPENLRGIGDNADGPDKLKTGIPGATCVEISGKGLGTLLGEDIKFRVYPGSDVNNNNNNNYDLKRNTLYDVTANLANLSFSDRRLFISGQNCYIVNPGGFVDIPILRANESKLGVQIPNIYAPDCTAYVLWETGTVDGGIVSVSNVNCEGGTFRVTTGSAGNAVVCIRRNSGGVANPNGVILWSWHIWVSPVDFKSGNKIDANSYTWMDRNLGALDAPAAGTTFATTAGMMYQWGRKDPFLPSVVDSPTATTGTMPITATSMTRIAASYPATGVTLVGSGDTYLKRNTSALAATGTFTYGNQFITSVQSPMLFIIGWGGSTAIDAVTATMGADSWGGEAKQPKSVYDPCPAGWRIPSGRRNDSNWASSWGTGAACTEFNATNGKYSKIATFEAYANAGCRSSSSGAFNYVGTYGCYWSGSVNGTSGYSLTFSGTTVDPSGLSGRMFGFSARCVQE